MLSNTSSKLYGRMWMMNIPPKAQFSLTPQHNLTLQTACLGANLPEEEFDAKTHLIKPSRASLLFADGERPQVTLVSLSRNRVEHARLGVVLKKGRRYHFESEGAMPIDLIGYETLESTVRVANQAPVAPIEAQAPPPAMTESTHEILKATTPGKKTVEEANSTANKKRSRDDSDVLESRPQSRAIKEPTKGKKSSAKPPAPKPVPTRQSSRRITGQSEATTSAPALPSKAPVTPKGVAPPSPTPRQPSQAPTAAEAHGASPKDGPVVEW